MAVINGRGVGLYGWKDRRCTLELAVSFVNPTTQPSPIEQLFEQHHRQVFRSAYRITGNAADAEDVLQQVFLRLLRRGAGSEPIENSEAYLKRAAINASLDSVRSRQASRSVPLETSPPGKEEPRAPLRESLRRALASLNPKAAEVFTLRFIEGYSNPEIAKMLGMSKVQVAVLVFRTRRQLQGELQSSEGVRS